MVGITPVGQQNRCLSAALAEYEVCCGHAEYLSLTLQGESKAGRAD